VHRQRTILEAAGEGVCGGLLLKGGRGLRDLGCFGAIGGVSFGCAAGSIQRLGAGEGGAVQLFTQVVREQGGGAEGGIRRVTAKCT
jgi:hypothetical protein